MSACITHNALRASDKDSRCHNEDTAFLGSKSWGKAISRFFSSKPSVRNIGPSSSLDLPVLRRAVMLTTNQCKDKQTFPKLLVLGSFYQVFLLPLVFSISDLRQPLPDPRLSSTSVISAFSPRSVITAGGDFHLCYMTGIPTHVFPCRTSVLLVSFAKNTISFPVTSLDDEWCEDNSFLINLLLNSQDQTLPQLTTTTLAY